MHFDVSDGAVFISIHALMKRATKQYPKPPKGDFISIHALMKRATQVSQATGVCGKYFNPRPHEEGDVKPPVTKTISSDFNPRPHEEGDSKFIQ